MRDDGALSSSLTGAALGFWGNKDAFDLQKKFLYKRLTIAERTKLKLDEKALAPAKPKNEKERLKALREAELKEKYMAYGTAMEPHAIYTFVRIVLPSLSLFKGLSYMEEGVAKLPNFEDGTAFISSSGDGSLTANITDTNPLIDYVVEIKCPAMPLFGSVDTEDLKDLPLHPKKAYISQMYLQAAAYQQFSRTGQLPGIVHVVWTPLFTRIWVHKPSDELLRELLECLRKWYFTEKKILGSSRKMPKEVLNLRTKLAFCAEHEWDFLGEFPSLMLPQNSTVPDPIPDDNQTHHTVIKLQPGCGYEASRVRTLAKLYQVVHENLYLESLRKATTAMMYTVSDLTREKNEYDTTYFLTCWLPCASDMDSETDKVCVRAHMITLLKAGINVVARSFDAKSRDLMVTGDSGEPLTIFSLQKQLWKEALKLKKGPLRDELVTRIRATLPKVTDSSTVPPLLLLCTAAAAGVRITRTLEGGWTSKKTGRAPKVAYLRAAWCHLEFPDRYNSWATTNPYWEKILGDWKMDEIWYVPDCIHEPGLLSRRIVAQTDYTHIFSRLRKFVMKGNIMRVKKEGWVYVAQLKDFEGKPVSALTLSMVDATGGDQMKITHTKIFFSAEVAELLRLHGYKHEAKFCQAAHDYLRAVDDRQILADTRIELMMTLCELLRFEFVIPQFLGKPPFGEKTYSGLSIDVVEELLAGMQARLCLYYMTPETGYAARDFGTTVTENLHGQLNQVKNDGRSHRTIEELTRDISHYQMLMKLKKNSSVTRSVYEPRSTIYDFPDGGEGQSQKLTSGSFDRSQRSGRTRLIRPFDRHKALRGSLPIRVLGGQKWNESIIMKG